MNVVAEGVETQAQLDFLLAHQCEYGQGYLFGRAVPLQELQPMLAPKALPAAVRGDAQSMNARLDQGT